MSQEQLDILRKLSKKPNVSQRELASELGISLGKLNYVLNDYSFFRLHPLSL